MGDSTNTTDAKLKDTGSTVIGDPDHWQLMAKFVSEDKSLIVSTKGMEVPGVGVLVSEYRKEAGMVSICSSWCPGCKLANGMDGGKVLIAIDAPTQGADPI